MRAPKIKILLNSAICTAYADVPGDITAVAISLQHLVHDGLSEVCLDLDGLHAGETYSLNGWSAIAMALSACSSVRLVVGIDLTGSGCKEDTVLRSMESIFGDLSGRGHLNIRFRG